MEEKHSKHSLSPLLIGLFAVVAIGILILVGLHTNPTGGITGYATLSKYTACCTIQASTSSFPFGARIVTELCAARESPTECCTRAAAMRFSQLLSTSPVPAGRGMCPISGISPEVSYPAASIVPQHFACCTFRSWQYSLQGEKQSVAQKQTTACNPAEPVRACCARAYRPEYPAELMDARFGNCATPEVNYPAPAFPTGFNVCCTFEMWQQSSTGYAQGVARTETQSCKSFESPSQCCIRATSDEYSVERLSVRILGIRMGNCQPSVPQASYPSYVR